jgi:hypothetical protein
MIGVLFAKAAVLAKSELFFHFFLVALGVMSNAAAHTALEFHQSILDLSHNFYQLSNYLLSCLSKSLSTLRENTLPVNPC